jgi:hypothetical protein
MNFNPMILRITSILGLVIISLVQIVGIVLASILIKRKAGSGAGLALGGFIVLLLTGVCGQIANTFIIPRLAVQFNRSYMLVQSVYYCLNGSFVTVGLGLLAFGIWQLGKAITERPNPAGKEEE